MTLYRTGAVVAVLSALDTERWRYVSQVSQMTGLHPGTVAKALRRLCRASLVESEWEDAEEAQGGAADGASRSRRHYYRLTSAGVQRALKWGEQPR